MGEEFVTIGRIVKTQGRHGEVAAELHTDFPERFEHRKTVFLVAEDGSRRNMQLDSFWTHKGQVILKFAGTESISEAESLIGCELQIYSSERAELEAGTAYVSELVGCRVWDDEREIGTVTEVRFGAGEAPLLVVKGAQEYEIPFAEAFLTRMQLAEKQIRMKLPEGLLDVNAPLTDEEKNQQRRA